MKYESNPFALQSRTPHLGIAVLVLSLVTTVLYAAGNCARTVTKTCGTDTSVSGFSQTCQSDYVIITEYSSYNTCLIDAETGTTGCLPDGTNTCTRTITVSYSLPGPSPCASDVTTNSWPQPKSKQNVVPCGPG